VAQQQSETRVSSTTSDWMETESANIRQFAHSTATRRISRLHMGLARVRGIRTCRLAKNRKVYRTHA
jgi:hypothetical protein